VEVAAACLDIASAVHPIQQAMLALQLEGAPCPHQVGREIATHMLHQQQHLAPCKMRTGPIEPGAVPGAAAAHASVHSLKIWSASDFFAESV